MTTLAVQDIPVSLKCLNSTATGTIPAGLTTFFQDATTVFLGCWVKMTVPHNGVDYRDFLILRGDSGSSVAAVLYGDAITGNFSVGGLGAGAIVYPAMLNVWTHIIGELDIANNRIRAWINGVKVYDAAAVFTRDLATVTSITSCIGDNALGFAGNIAEAFICNRAAVATQDEIDEIYLKGHLPESLYTFHWPIRRATIATIECENGSEQKPYPQNQFNAVISTSTMYSRDTPVTGRIVDRDAGNCLFMSGAAGYARHNGDLIYSNLFGRRYIGMSAWAMMSGNIAGGTRFIGQLTTSAGNAGLVIFVNGTGSWQFIARSTDGEAASVTSAPSPGYMPYANPREWCHMSIIVDFEAKIIAGYINGVLIAHTATATFAANVCQLTRGAQEIVIGHPTNFWPGKLDDFMLFHLTDMPSALEMRDWYINNKLPHQITPVTFIDCNDFGGPLIDKSGNNANFDLISLTVPYGLNHISYMG